MLFDETGALRCRTDKTHHQYYPRPGWVERAIEQTLGVYYRIDPTALCDLQAAILQIGAVYARCYGMTTVGLRLLACRAACMD